MNHARAWPMAANYFFFFAFFGVIVPFLSPLLLDLGYSKQQAGWIISALYLFNVVMPILGGRLSDRYFSLDRIIRLGGLGMVVFYGLVWVYSDTNSALFLVFLFTAAIFRGPMVPMLDALAIQVSDGNARTFSRLRLMGSIGFAVSVTLLGYLIDAHSIRVFFPFCFVLCCAFCLSNSTLPKEEKHVSRQQIKGFWRTLDRTWWIWLFALCCHWFAFAPYHYGYTLFLAEEGVATHLSGWIWALAVVAETGFFLASGWFFARWSYQTILIAAFAANLLRWILLALFPSPWLLAVAQLLHGPGFALFYAAALQGISDYCGGTHRASYQGLFSTAVGGLSAIAGTALAGQLHGSMPFRDMLLWFVPVQVLGLIIIVFCPLRRPSRQNEN